MQLLNHLTPFSQSIYTLNSGLYIHSDQVNSDQVKEDPVAFAQIYIHSKRTSLSSLESPLSDSSIESSTTGKDFHRYKDITLLEGELREEMASSWSSATTGKPQLSYAERLRRAKEGSATTKVDQERISSTITSLETPQKFTEGTFSPDHDKAISNGLPLSGERSSSTKKLGASLQDNVSSSSESRTTEVPAVIPATEANIPTPAVVNVWDARKKHLQERARALETEKANDAVQVSQSSPLSKSGSSSTYGGKQGSSQTQIQRSSIADHLNGSNSSRGSDWHQKVQILNDGANIPTMDGDGKRKKQNKTEESVITTPSSSFMPPAGSPSNDKVGEVGKSKLSKKKNKSEAIRTNDANTLMASSPIVPPSINDAVMWPSPDVALTTLGGRSGGVEDGAEDRSLRHSSVSPSTTSIQLKDLDVEVKPGGEKQKKGKQWISIVPTITHTAPLPGMSGKKKIGKGASVNGNNPSSASTLKKSGQNRQDNNDSQLLSPVMTRGELFENGSQRRSSSVASSQRMQEGRAGSPRELRSPALGGGSIRGPRFAADSKEERISKAKHRYTGGSNDSTTDTSNQLNALQLSNPTEEMSGAQLSSLQPETIESNLDGSFPPVRATATAFQPNFAVQDSSWMATAAMHRGRGRGFTGIRGNRGRGYTKRNEMIDSANGSSSSNSRNDNEERGLPSGVPSGPKIRNGSGIVSPSSEGGERDSQYVANYQRGYHPGPMTNGGSSAASGGYGNGNGYHHLPGPMYMSHGYYYPNPLEPYQIPMEMTPAELAPQGDVTKSEPSQALLHQIEFYFSHRNLEGDFYLRKNMNSQGFVPIDVVANFNKVKKLTQDINVVKETLLFSRALQVDTERSLVRKAIDWQLYVLVEGENPQQTLLQHSYGGHYPPQFIPPYPVGQAPFSQNMYGPPPPPPPPSASAAALYNQAPFPYPLPFANYGRAPPYPQSNTTNTYLSPYNNQHSRLDEERRPGLQSQRSADSSQSAKEYEESESRQYENAENDDDEEVFGVVAAEGLGGALKL